MTTVAVLLYPGCAFFEIALAAETLARAGAALRWFTPDGDPGPILAPQDIASAARAGGDGRTHWEGLQFERADLVEDGALITAQPWADRLYAATVALRLGLLSPAEAEALVDYPTRAYARGP